MLRVPMACLCYGVYEHFDSSSLTITLTYSSKETFNIDRPVHSLSACMRPGHRNKGWNTWNTVFLTFLHINHLPLYLLWVKNVLLYCAYFIIITIMTCWIFKYMLITLSVIGGTFQCYVPLVNAPLPEGEDKWLHQCCVVNTLPYQLNYRNTVLGYTLFG